MALQSLILPILSVFRSAGLQQASGVLRQMTGNFDSLAGKIGLAAGSFSAFSALTTARTFTTESVAATQLFERNLLALNQVFEELQPRMIAFTKEVENYGLSQGQAAQASVFLGSVLKQYGFNISESAGQTQKLVTLAQDLATTYGYDVQEALLAITALFRGEYDPIEKFGVAMKQNEVNARLAAQGLNDLEGAALANAQAIARLEMLFERAGDSVGAFARASDTLYGSQQRLNAIIGNLQISVGAPLQKPLAEINNIFADIFEKNGPGLVEVFEALGQTVDVVAPFIGQLTQKLIALIQPLQQVLNLITGVLGPAFSIINPILATTNALLETFNQILDAGSGVLANVEVILRRIGQRFADDKVFGFYIDFFAMLLSDGNPIIQILNGIGDAFEYIGDSARAAAGEFDVYNGGDRAASAAARRSSANARATKNNFEKINQALRAVATGTLDAEGKLQGLAGAFERIDDAKALNEAKQSMEDLGFSAGLIEEILTRPNWQDIFGEITKYARIAAMETSKVFVPLVGFITFGSKEFKEKAAKDFAKTVNELFNVGTKTSSGPKQAAKDTVKDFFDNMTDEIQKQTARKQLEVMGASAGLIEAILGTEGWMKLWLLIKQNKVALEDLQKQFNRTAAGAKELQDAIDDLAQKQKDYDEKVLEIQKRLAEELERIAEKAAAAKQQFADLLETFVILPTIEREVGRFEGQVVQMLESVEQSLRAAFRNKDILEAGYNSLREYARKELSALQEISRQRDELAKRFDLAQGLIDNYKKAFTAAMGLTSLFSRLKDETEKRTVTEVTKGVVRLGTSLREFGVTVTRSFEEPVKAIQNKTQALLGEFRTMADKARAFAENLRKLKQLGLDPMLFDELVQAGVIAGGETAQALVDGGSETINEINTLFGEINALGADLGEEVAATMYGTGIDMADGLLNGIRSKQQELEELARSMAEAFNREFRSLFNIQVDIAAAAASQAAIDKANADIAALGPRPELPEVPKLMDNNALAQLDTLIRNANRYAGNIKDQAKQLGALAKLDIYEQLRDAVRAGATVDMSQIRSGMSTAALQAAAAQAAPTIQNNFYVQPGNRMMQNETVETLRQFVNQNGSLVSYGIQ